MALRRDVPVFQLQIGTGRTVSVYGFNAADIIVPLVEIGNGCLLTNLTVEQAERLADGLRLAARVARGEAVPTALDQFLDRKALPR